MRFVRSLQHWLKGDGPCLRVADFVPDTHPIRQWADTFPWADLVAAIEQSVARRGDSRERGGQRPHVSGLVASRRRGLRKAWLFATTSL